jgi:hypothetical protein
MTPVPSTQLLLVFTVAAFGLAYIVGHSKISLLPREALAKSTNPIAVVFLLLIECPACLGFWIGGVSAVVWLGGIHGYDLTYVLLMALYTSGSNFILGRVTGLISDNP